MYISPVVSRMLLAWIHPPTASLTIFLPHLQCRSLSLEGTDLIKISHVRLSAPNSLALCPLSSCGFLFYLPQMLQYISKDDYYRLLDHNLVLLDISEEAAKS